MDQTKKKTKIIGLVSFSVIQKFQGSESMAKTFILILSCPRLTTGFHVSLFESEKMD